MRRIKLELFQILNNSPFVNQTSISQVGENEECQRSDAVTMRRVGPCGAYDENIFGLSASELELFEGSTLPNIGTAPTTMQGGMEHNNFDDSTV